MGDIVRLVPRTDRVRWRAAAGGESRPECQIIILPCVRYERWVEAAPKPTPTRKKRKSGKRRSRPRRKVV